MSQRLKVLAERGHTTHTGEVIELARNVCEAVRGSGLPVTKDTVLDALVAIHQEDVPPTPYFDRFRRMPESARRGAVLLLGEILEALDLDLPLAEEVEC